MKTFLAELNRDGKIVEHEWIKARDKRAAHRLALVVFIERGHDGKYAPRATQNNIQVTPEEKVT